MNRYCWALDLKNDAELIKQYKAYHKNIWPEIVKSMKDAGIKELEIYSVGNRMFMIMEVTDHYSIERKTAMDKSNPKVQEWEELMWTYQQALPWAKAGEKWMLMEKIFELE